MRSFRQARIIEQFYRNDTGGASVNASADARPFPGPTKLQARRSAFSVASESFDTSIMSFDFPTFLVAATAVTGGIWLIDALLFAPRRRRLAEQQVASAAATEGQGAGDVAVTGYREPVLVEYSRSFFPVILAVLLLRSFVVEPFPHPVRLHDADIVGGRLHPGQ